MANTYLSRTPSSASNRKTFTMSAWLKLSGIGSARKLLYVNNSSTDRSFFGFESTNTFKIQNKISNSVTCHVETNRLFRDTSAWYHLVIAVDTTQATSSNRVKLYVNGVQETSLSTATYPSQNEDWQVNNTVLHDIGRRIDTNPDYFDGYMSHVSFVDGQALAPTVFGETDSTSGIWKFKSPSGVTWGTNGFHLKFESSGNLGLDSSGNSNTFSVNGNGRQALDTPSNVSATFNPLNQGQFQTAIFSKGNLEYESTQTGANYPRGVSTLGVSSGKYYMEVKNLSSEAVMVGISNGDGTNGVLPDSTNDIGYHSGNGYLYKDGSGQVQVNTYTTNDIVGIALDLDNYKIYFSKNGVWQNSGNPTSGSTGTGAIAVTNPSATGFYFFTVGETSSSATPNVTANFGNGYFGTTAISSAGSNGNGSLFEYDVPSGYYALNTKNINTYG